MSNKNKNPIYLPILKGKKGEYDALKELTSEEKKLILPLIEIPAIPWDFVNEKPATTIEKQIDSSVKSIIKTWNENLEILIDTYYLEENLNSKGDKTLNSIVEKLFKEKINAVPVLNVYSSDELLDSLIYDKTICIRVAFNEQELFDINIEIERIIKKLKIKHSQVYLLLDMGFIDQSQTHMAKIASTSFYTSINKIIEFKEIFFAATSFPINLSSCKTNSITKIDRIEIIINDHFNNSPTRIKRIPKFSDYCVSNPEIEEIDPRLMTMSASIRYTVDDAWYIFKAASVKKYSFEQFYDLAKEITSSTLYYGEDFSWGDKLINEKSKRQGGTGNPTTWRQIATNHHLTLMITNLSS